MSEPSTVVAVLKTGVTLAGTLWRWRPLEGWFSLTACGVPGADRIEFGKCASIRSGKTDLLKAAHTDGWTGV